MPSCLSVRSASDFRSSVPVTPFHTFRRGSERAALRGASAACRLLCAPGEFSFRLRRDSCPSNHLAELESGILLRDYQRQPLLAYLSGRANFYLLNRFSPSRSGPLKPPGCMISSLAQDVSCAPFPFCPHPLLHVGSLTLSCTRVPFMGRYSVWLFSLAHLSRVI